MKVIEIKNKLDKKYPNRLKSVKKEFITNHHTKEPKIIGITGSNGKSSVAYLVHEYLKYLGYKSILYSTVSIDSPTSYVLSNYECEVPVKNELQLLKILEQVDSYEPDFLVLEVNESTLEKGIVEDLDFDVRVITNLNPKHNLEMYREDEYVNLKKQFFKNNKSGKMVIGLEDMDKELYEEFLNLNEQEKISYSSEYITTVKGINPSSMAVLLYDSNKRLDGQTMKVKMENKEYIFDTKLIMSYNMLNVLGVLATLKALGVLKMNKFMEFIKDIKVPGRAEIIKVNGRTIIIDVNLEPVLREYQGFKATNEVKAMKVVLGLVGSGYKGWDKKYQTANYLDKLQKVRTDAMAVLNEYADFVYLTSNDPGTMDVEKMNQELQTLLTIPSKNIVSRKEAIKQAIKESKPKDLIYITGRGARRHFCIGETSLEKFTDKEVVEEVLKEMGW